MKAIVLAAGKGTRLQSEKFNMPKVLRLANGRPLISYVLDNINFIDQKDTYIVVGYKKESVIEAIKGDYTFVSQDMQLGTGHAVMMAEPNLKDYEGDLLVLYGDMPLLTRKTLEGLIEKHHEMNSLCTILTAKVDNPPDYGRIIRGSEGQILDIVEKKDCTQEQLKINEINIGVYVFDSKTLFENLKNLKNNNAQKEYYLTDIPKILIEKGMKVYSYTTNDHEEIAGVNTMEELEYCEKILKGRK